MLRDDKVNKRAPCTTNTDSTHTIHYTTQQNTQTIKKRPKFSGQSFAQKTSMWEKAFHFVFVICVD